MNSGGTGIVGGHVTVRCTDRHRLSVVTQRYAGPELFTRGVTNKVAAHLCPGGRHTIKLINACPTGLGADD